MSSLFSQKIIRTVLVDDEDIALHRLRKALEAYTQIHIVGEAKAGKAAVALINALQPDLVFLDIQIPELSGLEVLNHLHTIPMVVFVTAYEEYAVKAFEKNSLDYLLKPVDDARLTVTIQRIMEKNTSGTDLLSKIQGMLEIPEKKTITTIPVKIGNKISLVYRQDIYFFEARDKYVLIHTADNEYLIDYSLTYLQERLGTEFIRIHRSYVINKAKIKEIHKYFKGTYIFVMNNAGCTKIKTSVSYTEVIKRELLVP